MCFKNSYIRKYKNYNHHIQYFCIYLQIWQISLHLIPGKRHRSHIRCCIYNHLQVLNTCENDWANVVRASSCCPDSSWPLHSRYHMEQHSEDCNFLQINDKPDQYQKHYQISLMIALTHKWLVLHHLSVASEN